MPKTIQKNGSAPEKTLLLIVEPVQNQDYCTAWISYVNSVAIFGREPIKKSSTYAFIWRSWCKFLAIRQFGQSTHYQQALPMLATAEDIEQFLKNGLKSSKPTREVSQVTKRRYYSVLQRIYAFCAQQDWIKINPVNALTLSDRPSPEKHDGHILNDVQWQACLDRIRTLGSSATEARNRAILLLLFTVGLRPEEIRKLQVHDFITGVANLNSIVIRDTTGPVQQRTLPVNTATSQALQEWIDIRKNLNVVVNHAQKIKAGSCNEELRLATQSLFVSRSRINLSMVALLNLVRAHIEQACISAQLDLPKRMGPQIIRNTRIVRWLNSGLDVSNVVDAAGLKNAKGLLHIAYAVPESVRAKILLSKRRDDEPAPYINLQAN